MKATAMGSDQLLPFIFNDDLYQHTERVIVIYRSVVQEADGKIYDNVIDPFLALFRSVLQDMNGKQWLELEKARQIQKTLENSIGEFHQNILTSMPGWEKVDEIVEMVQRYTRSVTFQDSLKFYKGLL